MKKAVIVSIAAACFNGTIIGHRAIVTIANPNPVEACTELPNNEINMIKSRSISALLFLITLQQTGIAAPHLRFNVRSNHYKYAPSPYHSPLAKSSCLATRVYIEIYFLGSCS
jgi:hypothetical protein